MQRRCQNVIGRLILALLIWSIAGCYAHRGAPAQQGPEEMLSSARDACTRQDRLGATHLLERFVREHPGANHSERAAHFLKQENPCGLFAADGAAQEQ